MVDGGPRSSAPGPKRAASTSPSCRRLPAARRRRHRRVGRRRRRRSRRSRGHGRRGSGRSDRRLRRCGRGDRLVRLGIDVGRAHGRRRRGREPLRTSAVRSREGRLVVDVVATACTGAVVSSLGNDCASGADVVGSRARLGDGRRRIDHRRRGDRVVDHRGTRERIVLLGGRLRRRRQRVAVLHDGNANRARAMRRGRASRSRRGRWGGDGLACDGDRLAHGRHLRNGLELRDGERRERDGGERERGSTTGCWRTEGGSTARPGPCTRCRTRRARWP